MKLGRLGYLPQTPSSSLVALAGLKFGVIFPISSGLPLTILPPLLPWSLTSPPGTQKVCLPAGVSCWGEGAGSAKDRFGEVGPQELESGGLCEGG